MSEPTVYSSLKFTGKDAQLIERLKKSLDKEVGTLTDTALIRIALRALAEKRGVPVP